MWTLFLFAVGVLYTGHLFVRLGRYPKPPGPRGWPLIGNLLDFPSSYEWEVFAKWGEKWGDLLSVTIFGTTIVVINSYKRSQEMLGKKSNIYSERPYVPMVMELVEMKDLMGFLPYDKRLKSSRRLFHQELGNNSAVRAFFPQEEQLGRTFVRRVLGNPDGLLDHCFQHAGAIILLVAYGYEAKESDDPLVKIANKAMDNFNSATAPGAFLVNQIPILMKIPDWFPGTEWKRVGRAWAKDYWAMVDVPFNLVKQNLVEETAKDSFAAKWLKQNLTPQEELDLKFTAGSMLAAGTETTAVTVHAFYLLMAMYPEVQKRAQTELESVIGKDRLPTFEDRERLPYVEAVCKEVLRYHAPVPIGLPHCTAEDDVHDGMLIPKGSIIFANIWNMTRDPEVYKNPMEFDPERFLTKTPEQDPNEIVFGFGRRICPGRLLSDVSIYITLAMSLAAFDIASCEGGPPLSLKAKTGIVSHIHPFKCKITPRMNINLLSALVN